MSSINVTILGCGRWASGHAWYQSTVLKNNVLMWGRAGDAIYDELAMTRKNDFWELPTNVELTSDLDGAINNADFILVVIAAQGMRELGDRIAKSLKADKTKSKKTFILCMKGIDDTTHETLVQVLRRLLDENGVGDRATICVWVGPGHTAELVTGQPGVMIVDGECREATRDIATRFRSDSMKLYMGNDLVGAEVGAAAKNVLGIAAGILDGSDMQGLKGALMARGAYEVSKLIVAMGGKQITAYGLSHLGDFEATLFSRNSNNRRFGQALIEFIKDKKEIPADVVSQLRLPLAEGVGTAKAMYMLAKKHNVEMPITNSVYRLLHKGSNPMEEFREIFLRGNLCEFGECQ